MISLRLVPKNCLCSHSCSRTSCRCLYFIKYLSSYDYSPTLRQWCVDTLLLMCSRGICFFIYTNAYSHKTGWIAYLALSLSFVSSVSIIGHELRCTNRLFLFVSWFLPTRRHYRHSRSWVGSCHLRGQAPSHLSRTPSCRQVSCGSTRQPTSHQDTQHDGTHSLCNTRRRLSGKCPSLSKRNGNVFGGPKVKTPFVLFSFMILSFPFCLLFFLVVGHPMVLCSQWRRPKF